MKNKITILILLISAGLLVNAQTAVKSLPQLGKDPVSKVVAAMTLEEKVNLVVGRGMSMPVLPSSDNAAPGAPGSPVRPGAPARPGAPGAEANAPMPGMQDLLKAQDKEVVAGAAGSTFAIPRLGIPSIIVADGPAGLRINPRRQNDNNTYYCTAFPVASLLASTWDPDLVKKVGQAMGNEVLEYGVDVILGPGMNIQKNPLCGRNFEYYSEDPLITGRMAASMASGIESQGVGVSIKHFAANNCETNRMSLNAVVSERALREIYLKGFGIVVQEAHPWTVMSSYNLINGTYASQNYDLLTKVLRNDWGFRGFVMTDWFGGKDPVAQMNAGNDLLMPGIPNQSKAILEAVKSGKLDVKVLDRNVERILNIVLQSPKFKGYKYSNKPDLKAHAQVTRQAATEGMVLLKNENSALPFSAGIRKIAAFGNTSYDIITGGTGSGEVNKAYSISLVEGLQSAGLTVNENLNGLYSSYMKVAKEGKPRSRGMLMRSEPIAELGVNRDLAMSMANVSDAAIITIGRNQGEGYDRQAVEGDFLLTPAENDMIKTVSTAFHAKSKKVIVILNVGGVIETSSWKELPDAILLAWQGGQEAGNSIADILVGKANPSGKLATTFPVKYEDVASAKNFPGKLLNPEDAQKNPGENDMMTSFMNPKPAEMVYEEGIYVGYRYNATFNVPVSYEFGYGLSYSTFEYTNLKLSPAKFTDKITVTVDVKNTGKAEGKEAVQLYLSAPAKSLDKPVIELKGFAKTNLLKPGESQTLNFVINKADLASFDTAVSAWKAEAGTYTVKIGASSKDIRLTASFKTSSDMIVKKESSALTPQVKINEIKPQ
jgi:beta-glucosidase